MPRGRDDTDTHPRVDVYSRGCFILEAKQSRAAGGFDAMSIASRFRQGKRVAPKVSAVLVALHRLGVVGMGDGRSFVPPRIP